VEHAFEFCPRTVALRAGEVVYDGPTRALDAPRLRALYGTQSEELFATSPGDGEPVVRTLTAFADAAQAA
ncbi:MAG: phosphonate ABC transporter ATP-binding protein, partial [Pseudomonadota bacterium]